jgi:hypothetical protein
MYKLLKILILTVLCGTFFTRCTSVKSYQKQYLNDHQMAQGGLTLEKLEEEGTSFREGAAGGTSAKTGGGCGCN